MQSAALAYSHNLLSYDWDYVNGVENVHVHFAPFAPGNRHKTLRFNELTKNGKNLLASEGKKTESK